MVYLSICLEIPEVQTSMVQTPHSGQASVDRADSGESSTSNTWVPTTKQKFQFRQELELSFETEEINPASTRTKGLTDTSVEKALPVNQPFGNVFDRQSTKTYPDASPTTLILSNQGHTGRDVTTLPAATPWKRTEATDVTTKMSTTPTSHRFCPHTGQLSQNIMKGATTWKLDSDGCAKDFYWVFILPEGYGFVVEFVRVEMKLEDALVVLSDGDVQQTVWRNFGETLSESLAPLLLREMRLKIVLHSPVGKHRRRRMSNFNLSYSAHRQDSLPEISRVLGKPTKNRVTYNCTGITDLPEAIICDGVHYCDHGEDEENCPYLAEGCGHWFPYNDQCLKVRFKRNYGVVYGWSVVTMPVNAEQSCQSEYGATLALLPDKLGISIVGDMIRKSGLLNAVVGIHKVKPVSRRLRHLYRFLWQWGDRGSPIAYEQQKLQRSGTMMDCAVLNVDFVLEPVQCVLLQLDKIPDGYVCMRPNPQKSWNNLKLSGVSFPRASASPDRFSTKECPDGSVVHTFHRCQWGEQAEGSNREWSSNDFRLFQCRFGPAIHYSLLCDGKDDCADRSDELDCGKPQFPPLLDSTFICRNLQAIPAEKRCNGQNDCFDESDEEYCFSCDPFTSVMCFGLGCLPRKFVQYFDACPELSFSWDSAILDLISAGTVTLDGYGMSRLDPAYDSECGEGYYSCRHGYCIPTFLLNNGEKDCLYGEDEGVPVNNTTCPGYYRCQGTGSCVHKSYVCDGIYHCPNKDDEMFCHVNCPRDQGCTCEGHAYKCSEMIDPHQHLHVRYLDLSHASNVSLGNIHFMEYLSFLNLSFCHLSNVTLTNMHQLQILDLSFNSLTELASLNLYKLSRLIYLDLSNNPFVKTLNNAFSTILKFGELQNLRTLLMANVSLEAIEDRVFSPLSKLTYLDIRANPVHSYNKESLWGLTALEELHTDESKLCCSYFHSLLTQCHAPVDELSSCSDLLAQDFFRVFLWTFSVLAIVGNAGVLIYRLFVRTRTSHAAFPTLVKTLCASDLLMGVYMMMIGVADAYYRGVYVAKEGEWTNSTACTIAGFLSLVSSEVSAFVICLITLDRVLVLCFPLNSRFHLSSRVIVSACCAVWITGILLAAVPLLVGMEFYGLNGICLPLPITRRQFSGQTYAFGVFIVLNFVLFVFIIAGQVCIYHAVRNASTAAGSRRHQQDMVIARRLFLVVFTDFCCWFPIGLMGLLAASGTLIPGEVNLWAAIFVLPLNSALNPFLYTLNGLMEQRKKHRMAQRTKRLIGKLHTDIPKWQPANVQELMRICVHSKLVEKEIIVRLLGINVDSATAMTSNKDLPLEPGAVYDDREFTSTAYDNQDVTHSSNIEVHDEVENRITEAVCDCKELYQN